MSSRYFPPMTYPPQTKLLAIDLATQTGWAVLANGVLTSGTESFKRYQGCKSKPADHSGQSYLNFERWLQVRITTDKPSEIAFEEPMGHLKSAQARNVLVGFRGILMAEAAKWQIKATGYTQTAVKKFAVNRGNAKKPEMLAWARDAFGDVEDENQADALAVLHLHLASQ